MRPHKPRRNPWVQLGIGAAALLLPPLAIGAAFYSMLAGPDEDRARPVQAVAQPVAAVAPRSAVSEPPPGKPAGDAARPMDREIPAQTAPVQVAVAPAANLPGANIPGPNVPSPNVPGANVPGANVPGAKPSPVDVEGNASLPPAAENPPASAPKRPAPRRARQAPFQLKNWLQRIGNVLRNPPGT